MTYRLRNIVLAVGLAAVAAMMTMFYVTSYKRAVQQDEKNVTVLVAARDIPEGTSGASVAARGLLERHEVARRSVVPGAVAEPEQIEDLVVAERIYAGEQVSSRRFRTALEQGIRAELTGNVRAFQIAGDPNQLLAGTLKRGDRIDVVASIKYKIAEFAGQEATVSGETDRVASRVVLRDLLVLKAPAVAAGEQLSGSTSSVSAQLAVTDSQAQKLFFVVKNGDWSLQLRPVVDAADSPDSVETIESVLGDGLRPGQYVQLYAGRRDR